MFYRTLHLTRKATLEDIKSSYRRLALHCHPDKPGGSQEQFQMLQKAYEVLSGSKSRADYDATLDRKRERMRDFVRPPPLSTVDKPVQFRLADDGFYEFETALHLVRCGLEHGDVIRFKNDAGCFIGLAGDQWLYWCKDGHNYASRMCERDSTFGIASIQILFRANISVARVYVPSSLQRSAKEKKANKSALERMRQELRRKEKGRLIAQWLANTACEESECRVRLAESIEAELSELYSTFGDCTRNRSPMTPTQCAVDSPGRSSSDKSACLELQMSAAGNHPIGDTEGSKLSLHSSTSTPLQEQAPQGCVEERGSLFRVNATPTESPVPSALNVADSRSFVEEPSGALESPTSTSSFSNHSFDVVVETEMVAADPNGLDPQRCEDVLLKSGSASSETADSVKFTECIASKRVSILRSEAPVNIATDHHVSPETQSSHLATNPSTNSMSIVERECATYDISKDSPPETPLPPSATDSHLSMKPLEVPSPAHLEQKVNLPASAAGTSSKRRLSRVSGKGRSACTTPRFMQPTNAYSYRTYASSSLKENTIPTTPGDMSPESFPVEIGRPLCPIENAGLRTQGKKTPRIVTRPNDWQKISANELFKQETDFMKEMSNRREGRLRTRRAGL